MDAGWVGVLTVLAFVGGIGIGAYLMGAAFGYDPNAPDE